MGVDGDAEAAGEYRNPRSHAAVRRLHESLPTETCKHRIGKVLESRWMEAVIVLLVLGDLALVSVEVGVTEHIFCVSGRVEKATPDELTTQTISEEGSKFVTLGRGTGGVKPSMADKMDMTGSMALVQIPHVHEEKAALPPFKSRQGLRFVSSAPVAASTQVRVPLHGCHDRVLQRPGAVRDGSVGHVADAGCKGALALSLRGSSHDEPSNDVESLVCETKDGPNAEHLVHRAHIGSIVILCIFVVEIGLKLWVNPGEFVRSKFEMLDFFVVVISLVLDTVIESIVERNEGNTEQVGELEWIGHVLIVLRLWRLVRIFHGAFEVVHTGIEQIHHLEETIDHSRKKCDLLAQILTEKTGQDAEVLLKAAGYTEQQADP